MARVSQKEKGRKILRDKTIYPEFNPIDYEGSLRKSLLYYNLEVDNKKKKVFALDYWKNENKNISLISKLGDGWFHTVGTVAHLATRGIDLSAKHSNWLEGKYDELLEIAKNKENQEEETVEIKPNITKEEKQDVKTKEHIGELEYALDLVIAGTTIDPKSYLVRSDIKPQQAKKISAWFERKLVELNDIDNDPQLKEAYSYLGKRGIKKLVDAVESIIAACGTASAITKAARKPRAKKAKPASQIVKSVKYLKESPEFKMTSVNPEKLVGASEVWIFNTKARRLFKYVTLDATGISVRGTSLTNFDVEKSGGKILRKPETQLAGYESMTSRPMNKLYNDIKASVSKATGRLNEDCLILKVF